MATLKAKSSARLVSVRYPEEDPLLEDALDMIAASGMELIDIAIKANVAISTLYNWINKKTKRPQVSTVRAVARACNTGYTTVLARWDTKSKSWHVWGDRSAQAQYGRDDGYEHDRIQMRRQQLAEEHQQAA